MPSRMRILFLLSVLTVLTNISLSQSLYSIDTIQTIRIKFAQSNWDYMMDTAAAGSEGYIMAKSVTINGTVFDSVGVKYKGNSSYRANQIKNPLHIEIDTYKEQDYQGYTDIKMSNVFKDPSFVREVLSYSILRQYMSAPLSNYANVYINDTLIGLYVSSESVSKKFVKKHFFSNNNPFFKCNPIGGAVPGQSASPNLVYLGSDSSLYYAAYEMNSDYGWGELINLCNTLKNNTGQIESILDVDRALWMLAFDNLLVNIDSYIGSMAQNYYLYKDNTGRFNCVVWDLNESFGTFSSTGTIQLNTTASKIQLTHLLHLNDANWPLVQKLLAVPRYKRMYLAHMQTMMKENFANGSYSTAAAHLQQVIDAAVQADVNKFFSYAQFKSNLTTDVAGGMGTAPGLAYLMNGRTTYLTSLADFTAVKPVITNIAISDSIPALNSNVFITAKVVNVNSDGVYLGFRNAFTDRFTRLLMYDDGAHGDGAAGDGVFGVQVKIESTDAQYYIYAENSSQGVFSPERAEHEYYSVKTRTSQSDILMNEVYARGTSANPDWVEIYNSSSQAIEISGYKIYDSGGQSGSKPKKTFPSGSIIGPKGFYVIITDDTTSSGFGLSNSGEIVWLENQYGALIDTVAFAAHTAAQSYGRVPDGGNWALLNTITRGTSNSGVSSVSEEGQRPVYFSLSQNYPNPFNPTTTITFTLPKQANVVLSVYNQLGQKIDEPVNGFLTDGSHTIAWDGARFSSGVYFYELRTEKQRILKKMLLLK